MSLNLDFSRTGGLSNTPVEYTNSRSFKNMYKGTGLSNTPVEYTNSRSFTNVYKGKGSISSSKLLQGLETGQGLNKGHTILKDLIIPPDLAPKMARLELPGGNDAIWSFSTGIKRFFLWHSWGISGGSYLWG